MKRTFVFLIFCNIFLVQYGQIIADHTVVADFDKIPQFYMGEVKKMMVGFFGESHSAAYRTGMELLETLYPDYACNVATCEAPTNQYLRVNNDIWTGEDVWYTWYAYPLESRPSISNTIKNIIKAYSDQNHPLHVIGFGWCWDMLGYNISSIIDPIYGCHWYGWSAGGPEGNISWGLDPSDYSVTGNSVSMDTYLNACEDYITYCSANNYLTKVVFTTGPVDTYYAGESGYQGYLKNEHIRNYVKANPKRILFDYADILCYNDNGSLTTSSWNGHIYPSITDLNLGDGSIGHIGSAGAIRLAKAQWWMLARLAGWDGITTNIPVTGITVTCAAGASTITTDNGSLQLIATVLPENSTNRSVTWSIINVTRQATINNTGLVTAETDGTVTAKATANDGSGVIGTLVITISNQIVTNINPTEIKAERLRLVVNSNEIRMLLNEDYISWSAGLYNLQGVLVNSKSVESDNIVFNAISLPSGIYFVALSNGKSLKVIKIIKP